jgi:RNA polymerase sigma-70 factor (ECF subfamily)
LYAYVRRRGFAAADAKDATQDFFVFLLERNVMAKADRERGRFRTFLLVTLRNFLADQHDRKTAQKRGGGTLHISWDEMGIEGFDIGAMPPSATAEACFDAAWAQTLAQRALNLVAQSYEQRSRGELFRALRGFLAGGEVPSYAEAGRQLGLSEAAATSAIHRLRHDYRAALRHLVAETVRDVADLDDELRYLMTALMHPPHA